MSQKKFFIVIALILLVGIGFVLFFWLRSDDPGSVAVPDDTGSDLFPFGPGTGGIQPGGGTVRPGGNNQVIDLGGGTGTIDRLRKLSDDEVSGAVITTRNNVYAVRYMDRATGHVFESDADTMVRTKISNSTMPQIYETMWASSGNEFVARYLKDDGEIIQTFYGRLSTSTPLEGYFLPANIRDISVASNTLGYLDPARSGVLMRSDIDGTDRSVVANLYTDEWLVQQISPTKVLVGTKPSGTLGGDLYLLDASNGSRVKIIRDVLGLTGIANADATWVFASAQERGGIASALYSVTDNRFVNLGLSTLSDKCVWGEKDRSFVYCAVPTTVRQGTYPDDWYQGLVTFEDRLWKIGVQDGMTDLVLDPSIEEGVDMDMTKLDISTDDSKIIFVNKSDSSLWVLDLK